MSAVSEALVSSTQGLPQVADLLGGPDVLRRRVDNPLEAHELLL